MPITWSNTNHTWNLSGGNVSYVLHVNAARQLMGVYWGKRVHDQAITFVPEDYPGFASFDLPVGWLPHEVPTLGTGWYGTPAIDVVNPQGDHVVSLQVKDSTIFSGKKTIEGLPATYVEEEDEATSLEITVEDPAIGLQGVLTYTIFEQTGALARSMRIINTGSEPLVIRGAQSASVPLWGNDYQIVHLKGSWARERSVVRKPIGEGTYSIFSQRGSSGHEENPFLALCHPSTTEHQGEVYAMNLIYSGSFYASAAVDNANNSRMSIGLNPQVFSWKLEPSASFCTPEAVLVFSDQGFNGMSAIYHKLYRTRLARGYWRDRERPILINNWEATYFDFTQEKILEIARTAHDLGIELFVMDDGWFGKRNCDNCSLGDWVVNREKLPDGLDGLSNRIHDLGMLFGLWMEPEMISPDSDLFRAHPDWCLHVKGRPSTLERSQLILDLSRAEVQDYVIEAVCRVLRESNADYLKWDMNRNMTEYFSADIPMEQQMEVQHRYMLGVYRILDAVVSTFPDVLFEACSGGGGRFDGGMLYYMPQIWTSDNTDAVSRLSIQYGTSMVYPISSMGAHVSAVPNHQCERVTSLKMRGDVALSGNFGFELDLTKASADEREEIKQLVNMVKRHRHLTQQGVFSRLANPEGGKYAAWQYISQDGSEALLCTFKILSVPNMPPFRVRMTNLDDMADYESDDGTVYSGAQLMYQGISTRLAGDFSSCVMHFTRKG